MITTSLNAGPGGVAVGLASSEEGASAGTPTAPASSLPGRQRESSVSLGTQSWDSRPSKAGCPGPASAALMPRTLGPACFQDRLRGALPPALCSVPLRSLEGQVCLLCRQLEPSLGPAWREGQGSLRAGWGRTPVMVPGTEGRHARAPPATPRTLPSPRPRARRGCGEGRRGGPGRAAWTGDRGPGTGDGAPPGLSRQRLSVVAFLLKPRMSRWF